MNNTLAAWLVVFALFTLGLTMVNTIMLLELWEIAESIRNVLQIW